MENLNLRMANQERIVTIGWLVAFGIMVLALNGCRNDSVSETEVDGSLGAGQTSVTLHVLNMAEEQGMF